MRSRTGFRIALDPISGGKTLSGRNLPEDPPLTPIWPGGGAAATTLGLCFEGERQELCRVIKGPLTGRLIRGRGFLGKTARFGLVLRHHLLSDELCQERAGVAGESIEVCGIGTLPRALARRLEVARRAICGASAGKTVGAPVGAAERVVGILELVERTADSSVLGSPLKRGCAGVVQARSVARRMDRWLYYNNGGRGCHVGRL